MIRILILGGTRDAVDLAEAAAALGGTEIVYSLAGVTREPNLPGCQMRTGGFGGAEGLKKYIQNTGIHAVIDATHPFAAEIAANTFAACQQTRVPRLKYLRPPWQPGPGDDWIEVASTSDAAAFIADHPGTVFLTIGSRELAAFAGLENCRFVARCIHPPKGGVPLENCEVVVDRGPFEAAGETELMRTHNVQYLIGKNSGGEGAAAKLIAARSLGIPIIMIARPAPPEGNIAATEAEAIEWLQSL